MAVVVEDGTIVTGANSFVTVAETAAYWAARAVETFADADTELQEAAVLAAAAYLRNERRFQYRGIRKAYGQTMPWPRTGATEYRGQDIPEDAIPWQVKEAQMDLALRAITGFQSLEPDLERGGRIQTETLDVITTTYFEDAPNETVYSIAMGLLAPILRQDKLDPSPFYDTGPADEELTPFARGEFENGQ